jgi:hypothetical protein
LVVLFVWDPGLGHSLGYCKQFVQEDTVRRILLFLVAAFFSTTLSVRVASGQTQQSTTPSPAPQDPQAVSIFSQALVASGGAIGISAVKDYTATGTVTYDLDHVEGAVTVQVRGAGQIRVDESLPNGSSSRVVSQGKTFLKGPDGALLELPRTDKVIPSSDIIPYHSPLFPGGLAFPQQELASALNNPLYRISYEGTAHINGLSLHDIRVDRAVHRNGPPSPYDAKEYFVDPSTFQVVMVQEILPKFLVHQLFYSNYTAENGILIPLSISEQFGGQEFRTIQLTQITFNSGLQDSVFDLK